MMTEFEMAEDISRMLAEMGFEYPDLGEKNSEWYPKLHAFVKAIYEERLKP